MSKVTLCIPRHLSQVDSVRWTAFLLLDWAVIGLAAALAIRAEHWAAWVAAIVVIGNRQHALGILAHDAVHYLAFRNRLLNDWIANLTITWLITWTVEGYRIFHFKHHRLTGTQDDPELELKRLSAPSWDLPLTSRGLVREVLYDLVGRGIGLLLVGLLIFPPPKRWQRIGPLLWPLALSATLIAFGNWRPVALWFLAGGTTFAAFMRLRMWIEHVGSAHTHRVKLSRFEALLIAPHNTWYHWEHHHYPTVPCFQLPKVRGLDASDPVMTLNDLWGALMRSKPVPSGQLPGQPAMRHPAQAPDIPSSVPGGPHAPIT